MMSHADIYRGKIIYNNSMDGINKRLKISKKDY